MKNFDLLPFVYNEFLSGPCKVSLFGKHQFTTPRLFQRALSRGGSTYEFVGSECVLCQHITIADEVEMTVIEKGWADLP